MEQKMKSNKSTTTASAVLWASAFLLAALVIIQAGSLEGNPAYAEMSVSSDGYTLLTTDAGSGGETAPDELLYVIDSREEVLLLYEIEDVRKGQIILRDGGSLRNLFQNARR